MARIPNKATFYRLWRAGLLGNRPRTWAGVKELRAALGHGLSYETLIVVRSARTAAWRTRYDVPVREALALAAINPDASLTFNEALDESRILIQGEVMSSARGLELTYSDVPLKMKDALAFARRYVVGLEARVILDHYLCPSSRDDLDDLFTLYPDSIIEFGVYDCNLGDQPNRNTLFWEVRDY
jgi:hypothetical protein